ncbi:MAG: MtnX-like HAD-IB family phosphatase [Acidobacteria bacterium]|nr:MtnX-like HAD-IB family phosphatase [Acidobacteriota bacterium]
MKENLSVSPWNSSPAPVVFSDFDGTISLVDVADAILEQFADPSWRKVEEEWVRGSIGSEECLRRQMALVKTTAKQLNALIDAVPLDPDFSTFYRFVQMQRLPFYIVSDSFDYVIRRALKRAGADGELRNGKHLFSSALRLVRGELHLSFPHSKINCPHGCATCKAAIIQRVRGERCPVVFVGDGLSDRFAVEEADMIFAKEELLDYCHEKGLDCVPFQTFRDVQAGVAKLLGLEMSACDVALNVAAQGV